METKNIGLRNIPIADTKISLIDGEKGKLIYRGFDVLDLTKNSNFEECCFLLLHDHLPNKTEFDEFVSKLRGMFSIVIYDKSRDEIISIVDRFGIKPLYYLIEDSVIYISSRIDVLNIFNNG